MKDHPSFWPIPFSNTSNHLTFKTTTEFLHLCYCNSRKSTTKNVQNNFNNFLDTLVVTSTVTMLLSSDNWIVTSLMVTSSQVKTLLQQMHFIKTKIPSHIVSLINTLLHTALLVLSKESRVKMSNFFNVLVQD